MNTFEVYAVNIQVSQLKKIMPTELHGKTDEIEKERNTFLNWLISVAEQGWNFTDQLNAWNSYVLFNYFNNDEQLEEEMCWLREIEDAYLEKVNTWANLRNYQKIGKESRNVFAQQ